MYQVTNVLHNIQLELVALFQYAVVTICTTHYNI
jgi:hypothetical protein